MVANHNRKNLNIKAAKEINVFQNLKEPFGLRKLFLHALSFTFSKI